MILKIRRRDVLVLGNSEAATQEAMINAKQFAKKVFVSPSSIPQYETGRISPSCDTLKRIADCFNVSTENLMGRGISVSQFLAKCIKITGKDREALLTLVDALEMHSTNSNETGT